MDQKSKNKPCVSFHLCKMKQIKIQDKLFHFFNTQCNKAYKVLTLLFPFNGVSWNMQQYVLKSVENVLILFNSCMLFH
jgi:hypothetical protein